MRPTLRNIRREPLVNKSDLIGETGATGSEKETSGTDEPARKKFVAPEISVPVDVLEATTFFQLTDSGATN
jgi:hypothetical protein